MKQIAILFAAVCSLALLANESQAQCGYGGGARFAPVRSSGFSLSVGNSFNQFGRNNFAAPIYRRPVYGYGGFQNGFVNPGFGVNRGFVNQGFGFNPGFGVNRGVSINVGRGFGGYGGFRPGCGW